MQTRIPDGCWAGKRSWGRGPHVLPSRVREGRTHSVRHRCPRAIPERLRTDLINQSCYHQIVSNDELEQVCEARCGSPMVSRAAIQERAIRLFGFDLNGTRFAACERLSKFHIKAAEVPSAGSVS
jgi:hypothetical protein